MTDTVDKATRSRIMASIKGKGTKPELAARKALHTLGLRFRLNAKGLPGKPDLTFPKYRTALFVHGCFWHSHGRCKAKPPASNLDYWLPKLKRNRERDAENIASLREIGWKAIIVWECELKSTDWPMLARKIRGEIG